MKHKFLKRLIVASVVTSTLVTLSPIGVSAEWSKNYYGNWSYIEGYRYITGWKQISGTWYFFDDFGQMRTGWIQSGDEWYYADLSGAIQTGVIQVEGKIYLLAENGGVQKGSCIINGKVYHFDNNGIFVGDDAPIPIKGFDYYGNSTVPYIPAQLVVEGSGMSKNIPSDGKKEVKQYNVVFKDPYVEDGEEEIIKTRIIDEDTNMLLYKPSKSGYNFVEWNTKSDGDGTGYEYDDKITIKKDITLYAQWKEVETVIVVDTTTKVASITVSGLNSSNTITATGGNLQMTKKVTPSDADNQLVKWSVINGADSSGNGKASISTTGKLTAVSNGTVTVRATAEDGSGIYGEFDVIITGQ